MGRSPQQDLDYAMFTFCSFGFKAATKSRHATGASPQQAIEDASVTLCMFLFGKKYNVVYPLKTFICQFRKNNEF